MHKFNSCFLSTAAESQESGSPAPSPTNSAASEPAPTLVHIKQEPMAPGTDVKEYYGNIDFGIPDAYLPQNFADYGQNFLPRPLDLPHPDFLDPDKSSDEKYDPNKDNDVDNSEYNLPNELEIKNGGVFARCSIPVGNKYGPFTGKWESKLVDRRYAWEVSFFSLKHSSPFLKNKTLVLLKCYDVWKNGTRRLINNARKLKLTAHVK